MSDLFPPRHSRSCHVVTCHVAVLVDICRLLLHERFIGELMVPQPLGHVTALRAFFRDLAHASIMRLDDESMGKMWDLMTMAVKQQAMRADSPGELLQATLNHLDYIAERVPGVQLQAELARQALVTVRGRVARQPPSPPMSISI